jgi:hypothetical protein
VLLGGDMFVNKWTAHNFKAILIEKMLRCEISLCEVNFMFAHVFEVEVVENRYLIIVMYILM